MADTFNIEHGYGILTDENNQLAQWPVVHLYWRRENYEWVPAAEIVHTTGYESFDGMVLDCPTAKTASGLHKIWNAYGSTQIVDAYLAGNISEDEAREAWPFTRRQHAHAIETVDGEIDDTLEFDLDDHLWSIRTEEDWDTMQEWLHMDDTELERALNDIVDDYDYVKVDSWDLDVVRSKTAATLEEAKAELAEEVRDEHRYDLLDEDSVEQTVAERLRDEFAYTPRSNQPHMNTGMTR